MHTKLENEVLSTLVYMIYQEQKKRKKSIFMILSSLTAVRFPLFCFAKSRKFYRNLLLPNQPDQLCFAELVSKTGWFPIKQNSDNIIQLINTIRRHISKHKLMTCEEKILITISGGQDSICLLLIFYILQNQMSFHLNCIWINHFWQKSSFFTMSHVSKCSFSFSSSIKLFLPLEWEESSLLSGFSFPKARLVSSEGSLASDCDLHYRSQSGKKARSCRIFFDRSLLLKRHSLVTSLSKQAGKRTVTQIISNPKQKIESKKYSEQKARNWRHKAIQRGASFYEYKSCLQGHTKSDRVETIFFNFIRGTGISGISALQWIKKRNFFFTKKYYPIFLNFIEQTHLTSGSY